MLRLTLQPALLAAKATADTAAPPRDNTPQGRPLVYADDACVTGTDTDKWLRAMLPAFRGLRVKPAKSKVVDLTAAYRRGAGDAGYTTPGEEEPANVLHVEYTLNTTHLGKPLDQADYV